MGANHSRDEANEAPVQVCSSLCSFCMYTYTTRQNQCRGLAGPWYARRERGAVKARIQWFNGAKVQMRARAQTRQKMRGSNGLQEVDEDKTKDQP